MCSLFISVMMHEMNNRDLVLRCCRSPAVYLLSRMSECAPGKSRHGGFHLACLSRLPNEQIRDTWYRLMKAQLLTRMMPAGQGWCTRVLIPKDDLGTKMRPLSVGTDAYCWVSGVVSTRLAAANETLEIFPDAVVAYRPGRGCPQLTALRQAVLEDANEFGKPLATFMGDWEKYYDEVSFELQQVAAAAHGVPTAGYGEWIAEEVTGRRMKANTSLGPTPAFAHRNGLMQGSPMSTTTISYVINLLHRMWSSDRDSDYRMGFQSEGTHVGPSLYSDDSARYADCTAGRARNRICTAGGGSLRTTGAWT